MTALKLTRDAAEADLWLLGGIGTLRRIGRISRAATAEADGRSWQIVRHGWVRTGSRATDATGAVRSPR